MKSIAVLHFVHGTWGRGLLPRRPGRHRKVEPFWFEQGSLFNRRLQNHLSSSSRIIRCRTVLWSGANSIVARDAGARRLLKSLLRAERLYPGAAQFVVAHSHGGNVALRALKLAEDQGANLTNVRIASLATPFIRLFGANKEILAMKIQAIVLYLSLSTYFLTTSFWQYAFATASPSTRLQINLALALTCGVAAIILSQVLATKSIRTLDIGSQLELARLSSPPSSKQSTTKHIFVRGVDDEASLALTFASILAKISTIITDVAVGRASALLFWAPLTTLLSFTTLLFLINEIREDSFLYFLKKYYYAVIIYFNKNIIDYNVIVSWSVYLLTFFAFYYPSLLVALMIVVTASKGAFGRELFVGSLAMDIAANSTPDINGHAQVITLLPTPDDRALRHFIYNYPDCATVVARWILGSK